LYHVKNLGLDQPGFLADAHDDVAFGESHDFGWLMVWVSGFVLCHGWTRQKAHKSLA
jgi:hypothetical protein